MSLKDWICNHLLKTNIMLISILKLKGAKEISKTEQKEVKGGWWRPDKLPACGYVCGPWCTGCPA